MLPELNAPETFCAKWAAAEIISVAQKSPLLRKCLKDRHPSANLNIDGARSKCWSDFSEVKVMETSNLFRTSEWSGFMKTIEIF